MNIAAVIEHPARQPRLGEKGLVVLIAMLSAFVPLSTDLYLPALPTMAAQLNAPPHLINLTLVMFFVFYALGTLVWGPLSDKYGRRPALIAGLTIYIAASLLCAMAWDVYALIVFRVFQAIGGSTSGAVATAIVKDVYSGRRRETVLALVQSMVLISPMVAPVIGALLLQVTAWRGVFWVLGGIGLVALAGSLAFKETIVYRNPGGIVQSFGRLGKVLQNRQFTSLMVLFSLTGISGMAFIASSSYIYVDGFGLSEQVYSYYFAFNALGLMVGPMLYLRLVRRFSRGAIIQVGYLVVAACGVLIFLFGPLQPWLFALVLLPASVTGSLMRPPGTNLMLEQLKEDTGSAASLIGCFGMLMGSLGMQIISFGVLDTILMLGVLNIVMGLASALLWPVVSRNIILPDQEPVEVAAGYRSAR